jgi:predicted ATPase/class 3 adenylate cyclase
METLPVSELPPAYAAVSAPTGTVTFLFTDIEGSTTRWDRDVGAMESAVRRHDTLMRAALAAHAGFVFKTIGDAFCAAFARPEDAVAAALSAQRALRDEDFSAVEGVRVRMAAHTGTADERDGDYFGPTVNRVARLLAIGHGGQVLLSGVTAGLVRPCLPEDTELRDLGEHRLKDLSASELVFQVSSPDLPASFPTLRSLAVAKHNLPLSLSSLVGREGDVADIVALGRRDRLVTLFGPGGIGKTRCAIAAALEMLPEFSDGVWFADFAPLVDGSFVQGTVAALFDVREGIDKPLLDGLVTYLRDRTLLLVLDNCEHVVLETSQLASAILRSCASVKIVATSREALKVAGERVHSMPSLAVPGTYRGLTAQAARGFGAIELFETRARGHQPNFEITDENAADVAEICVRLDGMPLAIELAAARVKLLAPRALARKLDERFRLLTGGDRAAMPRQQTMRALIDWSYDLLAENERATFRAAAVFAGSFMLETAVQVCAGETLEEFEVLDLIGSLVDKSLVVVESKAGETCYRLLESTRQYAREKLIEAGEYGAVATAHAGAYVRRAECLERDYETMPYREWLAIAEQELENVRAALAWSFDGGDEVVGQELAAMVSRVILAFAAPEARRYLATALDRVRSQTPVEIVARLHLADAHLCSVFNQFAGSLAAAERALAAFLESGSRRGVAEAQRFAGRALLRLGRIEEGVARLEASLAILRELGSRRIGGSLRELATAHGLEGNLEAARVLFAQALEAFRAIDDDGNVLVVAIALAESTYRCGDAHEAVRHAKEALSVARALGREHMTAAILANIAAYEIEVGEYEAAAIAAVEGLTIARGVGADVWVAFAIQHVLAAATLKAAALTSDEAKRAVSLLAYIDARLQSLDVAREYTEEREYLALLEALKPYLEPAALEEARTIGSVFTEDRAMVEMRRFGVTG